MDWLDLLLVQIRRALLVFFSFLLTVSIIANGFLKASRNTHTCIHRHIHRRFLFAGSISLQFSHSFVSDSLRPHELQHRLPCPSPTPGAYSNSCPLSWWCHPIISSSVDPFSSCLQSFPASGSFWMSQFFASGGQSIGVLASASVLPMNIQD